MEVDEESFITDGNEIQCEVIKADSIYINDDGDQFEGLEVYPVTIVDPPKPHEVWSNQETSTLISLHKAYDERFKTAAPGAKKEIWEQISRQLHLRGSSTNKTGIACDDKWRRLKCRYLMLKNKYAKNGTKGVPWTFYRQMQAAVEMDELGYTDDPLTQTEVDALIDGLDEVTEDHSYFKDTSQDSKMHDPELIVPDLALGSSQHQNSKEIWTPEAILQLIALYHEHKQKGHRVWPLVSKKIREAGYSYSLTSCIDKFKNLKYHYNRHKVQMKKYGTEPSWIHYKDMDAILGEQTDSIEEDTTEHFDDEIDDSAEILETPKTGDQVWSVTATKLLIALRRGYSQRFELAPQGQKIYLWREIANKIKRQGVNVSAFECNSKYRRLKTRYMRMKERSSERPIKWIYFKDLDAFLGKSAKKIKQIKTKEETIEPSTSREFENSPTTNILGQFLSSSQSSFDCNNLVSILGATLINELLSEKKKTNQIAAQREKSFQERLETLESMNRVLLGQHKDTQELIKLQTIELAKANDLERKKIDLIEKSLAVLISSPK